MRISGVEKGFAGEKAGLHAGDDIRTVNDFPFLDILDYEFYDAQNRFTLSVRRPDGRTETVKINKKPDESLGLIFADDGLTVKACRNRCVFCFVDQLPKDPSLRKTLRVKDDDFRHSFLYGSYVTLTNLTDADIERIKRLKLSPLYVSVHSTDETVRKSLLGIRESRPVLPILRELNGAGIRIHTQIVYCPGLNDDIEQTARALGPYCESLAVVPVGLTRFCNPTLRPVSKKEAVDMIDLTEKLQIGFFREKGTRFIWASDEFYVKAEREIPPCETYKDYPQIENGVGLYARFNEDFGYALSRIDGEEFGEINRSAAVSIATGISAYPFISEKARALAEKYSVPITVYPVENRFFGSSVTVAGLLTGGDIARALKGKPLGERLLLPDVMFREGSEEFLDNMTLSGLSEQLKVPVEKIPADGESFVYKLLGVAPQG